MLLRQATGRALRQQEEPVRTPRLRTWVWLALVACWCAVARPAAAQKGLDDNAKMAAWTKVVDRLAAAQKSAREAGSDAAKRRAAHDAFEAAGAAAWQLAASVPERVTGTMRKQFPSPQSDEIVKDDVPAAKAYFPRLAAGYAYWMAARLADTPDAANADWASAYDYLGSAYRAGANGALEALVEPYGSSRDGCRDDVYMSPAVLRMLVQAALGLWHGKQRFQEEREKERVLALFAALSQAEATSKATTQMPIPTEPVLAAWVYALAEEEARKAQDPRTKRQSVQKQNLPVARQEFEADVQSGMTQALAWVVRPLKAWPGQPAAGQLVAPISVSVDDSPIPLEVTVVDAQGGAPLPDAKRTGSGDVPLPRGTRVLTVKVVSDIPAGRKLADAYRRVFVREEGPISVQTLPSLKLAEGFAGEIAGRTVSSLAFDVENAAEGDELVVREQAGKAERGRLALKAGSARVPVPAFDVAINESTSLEAVIRRGTPPAEVAALSGPIRIASSSQPVLSLSVRSLKESPVALVRAEVTDYEAVQELRVNGVPYADLDRCSKSGGEGGRPTTRVYLFPRIDASSGVSVSVTMAHSGKSASGRVSAGPAQAADEKEYGATVGAMPEAEPMARLARVKSLPGEDKPEERKAALALAEGAASAYKGLLGDAARGEEARSAVRALVSDVLVPGYAKAKPDLERVKKDYADGVGLGDLVVAALDRIKPVPEPPKFVDVAALEWNPDSKLAYVKLAIPSWKAGQSSVEKLSIAGVEIAKGPALDDMVDKNSGVVSGLVYLPAGGISAPPAPLPALTASVRLEGSAAAPQVLTAKADAARRVEPLNSAGWPADWQNQLKAIRAPLPDGLKTVKVYLRDAALRNAVDQVEGAVAAIQDPSPVPPVAERVAKAIAGVSALAASDDEALRPRAKALAGKLLHAVLQSEDVSGHQLEVTQGKFGENLWFRSDVPTLALRWQGQTAPITGARERGVVTFRIKGQDVPPLEQGAKTLKAELYIPEKGIDSATMPVEIALDEVKVVQQIAVQVRPQAYEAGVGEGGTNEAAIISCTLSVAAAKVEWRAINKLRPTEDVPWTAADDPAKVFSVKRLPIPAGRLPVGAYDLQVRATAPNSDPSPPATATLNVVGPAVALVVGNDYYADKRYQSLSYAVKDAQTIRALLKERFGYQDANIVYVYGKNGGGKPSLDTNGVGEDYKAELGQTVTARVLHSAVARLKVRIEAVHARHVLIFFSGHGNTKENEGGPPCNAFVCADGEQFAPVTIPTLIGSSFGPGKSKPTIIGLYDACRSADVSKLVLESGTPPAYDYFPLYSCRLDQTSKENSPDPAYAIDYGDVGKFRNGFFTFAVDQAVRGFGDGAAVSVKDLIEKVGPVLSDLVKKAASIDKGAPKPHYPGPQDLIELKDVTDRNKELIVFGPLTSGGK